MVDQLLVKKRHSFDMFVMFAISLMIISEEFEKDSEAVMSFKEIVESSKEFVKENDFIEAFNIIYEKIPVDFDNETLKNLKGEKNRLL